jgi:CTP:molybdopterin cytidylyltransferase MocA
MNKAFDLIPIQNKISAIILAAGFSERMGKFKPLLKIGNETVLERATSPFRAVGMKDIRVVTGFRASDLKTVIKRLNIQEVFNQHYQKGMFSSVQAGVKSLAPEQEAFFILPVDIPLVRAQTIRDLIMSYQQGKGTVHYPVFEKMRGHPPLISTEYARQIEHWQGEGGLRSLLNLYKNRAVEVPVADAFIRLDMDSPSDYKKIVDGFRCYEIPTAQECMAILKIKYRLEKPLVDHCLKVARIARMIGKALREKGCRIDLELLTAAALLHDLVRKERRHALKAAQLLNDMGYSHVADIVRFHMDIIITDPDFISEREILYLADKIVQVDQVVSLKERFSLKTRQFKDNPEALAAIEKRMHNASRISERVQTLTGKSIDTILTEGYSSGPEIIF